MEKRRVLFITSQHKSYAHPPLFPKGFTPDPNVLHLIRMKYCDGYASLLTFLAHFHLLEALPEVIIVDGVEFFFLFFGRFRSWIVHILMPSHLDFSDFFMLLSEKSDSMAHALALLRDAADYSSSVLYG